VKNRLASGLNAESVGMTTLVDGKLALVCRRCRRQVVYDQPCPYHAGFSDQGFLYNDSGTLPLVWSVMDPLFQRLFPDDIYWSRSWISRRRFETLLLPAPSGGRWRFRNPARCPHCGRPISPPMQRTPHYLLYPGSLVIDPTKQSGLGSQIESSL
jgi:hypothetical protein